MHKITQALFASAIAVTLAGSASAQQQGGGGQGGGGQGQGGGQQGGQGGQAAGLPFGAGGNVGLETQQMQTVNNSVTNSQSNVLGGYYANPYYQGRIGTYGGQSPGGFGQAVYSATGSASGASGRTGGGVNTGFGSTGGRTGGTGNMTSTGGFGGTGGATQGFSGGSTGFGGAATGGARAGQTGQAGFGGGQTGFGGAQTAIGGRGAAGGQAGGFGAQTGLGGGGRQGRGMTGNTNPNAVAADRSFNVLYQPAAMGSIGAASVTPLATRAQTELRGQFDRTTMITAGKSIDVQVNGEGIARLRGTVASNDEKRLAIGLAQLTPGVRTVVSELTVKPVP